MMSFTKKKYNRETAKRQSRNTCEVASYQDEGRLDRGEGRADHLAEVNSPLRVEDAEVEIGELHHPNDRARSSLHVDEGPTRLIPRLGIRRCGGRSEEEQDAEENPFTSSHGCRFFRRGGVKI